MRELSYEEMKLVTGGCENCETGHTPEQCTDSNCDVHESKFSSCTWRGFAGSILKGAVGGALVGGAFGGVAGAGVGATRGAVLHGGSYLASCWW